MNRVLMSAAVVLAVVVGVMLNVQVLSAEQARIDRTGGPCAVFGADANGDPLLEQGEITMILENKNKVMMKCKGTGITNLSGSEQTFEGFPCGVVLEGEFVPADETHASVSIEGDATMICTIHK